MNLELDESALCRELEPLLDDPLFRQGVANLSGDPFFVAFFLASVSQGEGLGDLEAEDYQFPAERAVRQVVAMTSRYANAVAYRAEIESA